MKIVNLRNRAFAFPTLLNLPKFLNLFNFSKFLKLPYYISAKKCRQWDVHSSTTH